MRVVRIMYTMKNPIATAAKWDEDEMYRFLSDTFYQCPYYQLDDEYRIVRKQM